MKIDFILIVYIRGVSISYVTGFSHFLPLQYMVYKTDNIHLAYNRFRLYQSIAITFVSDVHHHICLCLKMSSGMSDNGARFFKTT